MVPRKGGNDSCWLAYLTSERLRTNGVFSFFFSFSALVEMWASD